MDSDTFSNFKTDYFYECKHINCFEKELDNLNVISLSNVREESRGEIPTVEFRMGWSEKGFWGRFDVNDFSILAQACHDLEFVWFDSCVEFFVKPLTYKNNTEYLNRRLNSEFSIEPIFEGMNSDLGVGYINLEFNCIGKLFASHVIDNTRVRGGFKKVRHFSLDECSEVIRQTKLRRGVMIERKGAESWWLEFFVPVSLLRHFMGDFIWDEGGEFLCNFYKCGDGLKNPHWISWSHLSALNFHNLKDFGKLMLTK